jgi:hypothetical protein
MAVTDRSRLTMMVDDDTRYKRTLHMWRPLRNNLALPLIIFYRSPRFAVVAAMSLSAELPDQALYVALSGHTGGFSDVADLVASVRSDIFLEGGSVPHLPVSPGAGLSNYLYSFFKDGDVVKLSRENGIRKAGVWFVLKDVSLVLAIVVAGLECYLRDGSGAYFEMKDDDDEELELSEGSPKCNSGYGLVLAGFQMVKEEFEVKFRKMFA